MPSSPVSILPAVAAISRVAAAITIDPTGTNNSVLYTAQNAGTDGNGITVQYAISGTGSAVLSVGVTDKAILVTAGSATTAASLLAAVNAAPAAAALVLAAASGTVTGTIAAVAATNLSGGTGLNPPVTILPAATGAAAPASPVEVLAYTLSSP